MFSRLPIADGHILTAANEWENHSAECGEYAKRIWRANKEGACLCFEGKRLSIGIVSFVPAVLPASFLHLI